MAANLFQRLERFREESQVMAEFIMVSQSVAYVSMELLWQLKSPPNKLRVYWR